MASEGEGHEGHAGRLGGSEAHATSGMGEGKPKPMNANLGLSGLQDYVPPKEFRRVADARREV
jgi:hypothetical protein